MHSLKLHVQPTVFESLILSTAICKQPLVTCNTMYTFVYSNVYTINNKLSTWNKFAAASVSTLSTKLVHFNAESNNALNYWTHQKSMIIPM